MSGGGSNCLGATILAKSCLGGAGGVNVRKQCPRWGFPVKKLSRDQFPGWLVVWGIIIQRETVLDFKSILRESLKTRQDNKRIQVYRFWLYQFSFRYFFSLIYGGRCSYSKSSVKHLAKLASKVVNNEEKIGISKYQNS